VYSTPDKRGPSPADDRRRRKAARLDMPQQ
jgi:hypothetical protein